MLEAEVDEGQTDMFVLGTRSKFVESRITK